MESGGGDVIVYIGAFTAGQLRSALWSLSARSTRTVHHSSDAPAHLMLGRSYDRVVMMRNREARVKERVQPHADAPPVHLRAAQCSIGDAVFGATLEEFVPRAPPFGRLPGASINTDAGASDNLLIAITAQTPTTTVAQSDDHTAVLTSANTPASTEDKRDDSTRCSPSPSVGSLHECISDENSTSPVRVAVTHDTQARTVAEQWNSVGPLGTQYTHSMMQRHSTRKTVRCDAANRQQAARSRAAQSRLPNVCTPFRELSVSHFELVHVDASHFRPPDAVLHRSKASCTFAS